MFLTEYEQEKQKLENAPDSHKECPPEAKVILSVVDQYLGADHYDKLVDKQVSVLQCHNCCFLIYIEEFITMKSIYSV